MLLEGVEPTSSAVKEYRLTRLGRTDGDTLITELSVFRRLHLKDTAFFTGLTDSQQQAVNEIYVRRLRRLKHHLERSRPSYVICYGLNAWREFQSFLGVTMWAQRAVPDSRKIFQLARLQWGGIGVLTPFFGRGGLLAYKDIEQVSALIRVFESQRASL